MRGGNTDEGDSMKYFATFLIVLGGAIILLMPAWIIGISRISLPLIMKRIIVLVMVVGSTVLAFTVILKPATNRITGIFTNILLILYLLILFISAYRNWPR
jgi:hypothetical protein